MEKEIIRKRNYRVIHLLEDGRKKYSTHKGEIEVWRWNEIKSLEQNLYKYGAAAFTSDFKHYDVVAADLKVRYPRKKIIRVVGFEWEEYDRPLNPDIIL